MPRAWVDVECGLGSGGMGVVQLRFATHEEADPHRTHSVLNNAGASLVERGRLRQRGTPPGSRRNGAPDRVAGQIGKPPGWRKPVEVHVRPAGAALSDDHKFALSRRLFLGQTNVNPTRWENKAGKAGCAPACAPKMSATFRRWTSTMRNGTRGCSSRPA